MQFERFYSLNGSVVKSFPHLLTATATCSQKHQIFIVGGWCYYTEGGRTTMASDKSGCQMTGRHSSKIN